jgi:hypothetical protein
MTEWRVEVELGDEGGHEALGQRLRSLDLDDDARKRLGDRVIVTRDGGWLFLYAGSEEQAEEAEKVIRELLGAEGLSAQVSLTRWHDVEEAWKDASVPLPETEQEIREEERRREAAEERETELEGRPEWEVRVDVPSLRDTLELADKLKGEGMKVHRRWKHLLVAAPSEEGAAELGKKIEGEAPKGSEVTVVPTEGAPHPVWVFIGAHTPGAARDLGL